VSRWQARIEQHGDSLLLVDESTNGTIRDEGRDGSSRFIRHDEIALEGSRTIALGLDPREHPAMVAFEVVGPDDAA
jgi:hypothetical protein